jgi:tetratricopeptide (TPR) repeat protein
MKAFRIIAAAALVALAAALSADAPSLYHDGLLLEIEEDWIGAVEKHLGALALNPSYADPMISLARCYYELGEFGEALAWVGKAKPLRKGAASILSLEGQVLTALGRHAEAEKAFNAILAPEPNNLDARFGLALLDLARGKPLAAVKRYEDALRLSPLNARALVSLALVYEETGSAAASRAAIEEALRAHSSDARVRYYAGWLAAAAGSYADAIIQCETALSLKPSYPEATRLLAASLYESGNPGRAREVMERALASGQRESRDLYILGLARAADGRPEAAVSALSMALESSPEDEIARMALERVLLSAFKPEEKERAPWAAYHFKRAAERMARDSRTEAAFEFRRGLRLDPYSLDGRVAYAELLRKQGYPARHLRELETAKELGKADERVDDAIESYSSLLADSVSRAWGMDQFLTPKRSVTVSVFRLPGAPGAFHADAPAVIADFVREIFVHSRRIALAETPASAQSFAEAFRLSREAGADYFLIVKAREGERDASISVTAYSGRTGGVAGAFNAYRSGNDRVRNAALRVVLSVEEALPLRGALIARSDSRALAGLGKADGLKAGDEFIIVKKGKLLWSESTLSLSYAREDVVGTFKAARLDDEVSEGETRKEGFFDMVNPGDEILRKPAPSPSPSPKAGAAKTAPPEAEAPDAALYGLLKSVR